MYKYTVEGLAEAEEPEPLQAPSPVSDTSVHSQGQYEFELKGVVVHSGTAFAGHYYSYIKVGRTNAYSLHISCITVCQDQPRILTQGLHAFVSGAQIEVVVMLCKCLQ